MGERLGNIHRLLYVRICFLSEWNSELCKILQVQQAHAYHTQPLEAFVEEGNLHESLQEMIKLVQQEHAHLAEELEATQGRAAFTDPIANIAGRHSLHGDLLQLLEGIKARFLHGMPCDKSLVIQQMEDHRVSIQWKQDTQASYFHDASLWYWQRQCLIQRMLPKGFVYEECEAKAMLYKKEDTQTWVEQLEQEHAMISRILDAMHAQCLSILQTKTVNTQWMADCLRYLQEYADVFHHQKEENLVFSHLKEATLQGKVLVEQGMLVEHDMARYYIRSMKKLLEEEIHADTCVRWIGYLQAYMDLLHRHIEKENEVAYPYARRVLSQDEIQKEFDDLNGYASMKELEDFLDHSMS